VGLAALAVGLAAGVGASKVDLHGHRSRTATQVQPLSLPQSGSQVISLPATSSGTTAASLPYLYLVGSTAQAQEVQQGLDWVGITGQPLDARVLVVPPEVSGGEVAETMDEAAGVGGLVPVTVEDLRPAALTSVHTAAEQSVVGGTTGAPVMQVDEPTLETAPAAPADPHQLIPGNQGHVGTLGAAGKPGQVAAFSGLSAFADVPMSPSAAVYLVGSAAQLNDVQQRLDRVRAAIWWQPLDATVQVVATAADDALAQETIARQNTMRSLVGLAPLTVVDLRTSPATPTELPGRWILLRHLLNRPDH
jgi:hypothetical protein